MVCCFFDREKINVMHPVADLFMNNQHSITAGQYCLST